MVWESLLEFNGLELWVFKGIIGFGFFNVCEGFDFFGVSLLGKIFDFVKEYFRY